MIKDRFEQLMKEQLGKHEMPVDPALWKKVSTQAGLSSGGAGLGLGPWLGIVSAVALISAGVFYVASVSKKPNTHAPRPIKSESNSENRLIENLPKEEKQPSHANELISSQENHGSFQHVIPEEENHEVYIVEDFVVPSTPQNNSTKQEVLLPKDQHIPALLTTSSQDIVQENANTPSEYHQKDKDLPKAIVMPNAITPNSDGVNDVLSLEIEGLTDFNVVILDALNQVVFSSTDPKFVWNGLLQNGDPAPSGTYQYYYTAKNERGEWCHQFSTLTLLR